MADEQSRRPHTLAWAICLIAVPMLYLVSFPWIDQRHFIYCIPNQEYGPVYQCYAWPWNLLKDHTPLGKTMETYAGWCWSQVKSY